MSNPNTLVLHYDKKTDFKKRRGFPKKVILNGVELKVTEFAYKEGLGQLPTLSLEILLHDYLVTIVEDDHGE